MNTPITPAEVAALDEKRTQGEWKMESYNGKYGLYTEASYYPTLHPDMPCDLEDDDLQFIAAAPRMATLIAQMDKVIAGYDAKLKIAIQALEVLARNNISDDIAPEALRKIQALQSNKREG